MNTVTKTWAKRAGLLAVLTVLALAIAVAIRVPAAVAYACPGCFGLKPVTDKIFVEDTASAAEIALLLANVNKAERLVGAVFGAAAGADPTFLACRSDRCERRLGGRGAKAQAYGETFIHLSPDGWNPTILAHELSHIEANRIVGLKAIATGALPAWFNEGLAVVVSRDRRYLAQVGDGKLHCLADARNDLPTTSGGWARAAGVDHRLYASAACRVKGWMERNGGNPGVVAMLRRLGGGGAFVD